MKLSEIVASLKELKETVSGFISDKTKATTDALAGFSAKLTALETGAVAEVTQKTSDLATAQTTIGSLTGNLEKAQGEVNAIGGALKAACSAMKLEIKDGATSLEMISAMQSGVTGTLAKLQVHAADIPAAAPVKGASPEAKPELKGRARMVAAMKIEGVTTERK